MFRRLWQGFWIFLSVVTHTTHLLPNPSDLSPAREVALRPNHWYWLDGYLQTYIIGEQGGTRGLELGFFSFFLTFVAMISSKQLFFPFLFMALSLQGSPAYIIRGRSFDATIPPARPHHSVVKGPR